MKIKVVPSFAINLINKKIFLPTTLFRQKYNYLDKALLNIFMPSCTVGKKQINMNYQIPNIASEVSQQFPGQHGVDEEMINIINSIIIKLTGIFGFFNFYLKLQFTYKRTVL